MNEQDRELHELREHVLQAYRKLVWSNPDQEDIYKALEKDHRDKFNMFKKLLQKRLDDI